MGSELLTNKLQVCYNKNFSCIQRVFHNKSFILWFNTSIWMTKLSWSFKNLNRILLNFHTLIENHFNFHILMKLWMKFTSIFTFPTELEWNSPRFPENLNEILGKKGIEEFKSVSKMQIPTKKFTTFSSNYCTKSWNRSIKYFGIHLPLKKRRS